MIINGYHARIWRSPYAEPQWKHPWTTRLIRQVLRGLDKLRDAPLNSASSGTSELVPRYNACYRGIIIQRNKLLRVPLERNRVIGHSCAV